MSAEARELNPQAAALEAQAGTDAFVAIQAAAGHTDNPHMVQLVGNRAGLLRLAAALLRQAALAANPIDIQAVHNPAPAQQGLDFVDDEHSVVQLVQIVHQETPPHEPTDLRKPWRDRVLTLLFVIAVSYFAVAGIIGGFWGIWWLLERIAG